MIRQHGIVALAIAAGSSLAMTAHAGVLQHTTLPQGSNSVNLLIDGVNISVTSQGGNFKQKTVAGFTATGVSGGEVDAEIDNTESLLFTFSAPVTINSLSIAHLYKAGNFGDQWNEEAKFITTVGTFELEASHPTTADWEGLGSVTNNSPATDNNGGAWTIHGTDIFGGAITSLRLKSGNPGDHPKYGDFGFRELRFSVVPAPGALALLGAAGLAARRRRR